MDVSGDMQVATEANIHRHRLASDGSVIGKLEYEDHAHDNEAVQRPNAALNPMLAALGLGGGYMPNSGPDQHVDKKGEGCNIVGTLLVNKVAGNVHIALGGVHSHGKPHDSEDHTSAGHAGHPTHDHGHAQAQPQQQHIHQFMIQEMATYNCSHTINQVSSIVARCASLASTSIVSSSLALSSISSHSVNYSPVW